MLTPEENQLVTRIGPGTPMGAVLRRFWHPVFRSIELEPGAAPQRLRLLGENYVLFRAPDGRIALFAEGCPHRGASLALARVEDGAIRCIFHGWKIDVGGTVVDAPSEPAERARFGEKVPVRRFPVREAGGLVWAYVGPGGPAQFPDFPFTHLPADRVKVLAVPINCNWLQGIEGQIDSSHVSILHSSTVTTVSTRATPSAALTQRYFLADRSPTFEVVTTEYGMRAAAIRRVEEDVRFARVTEFCMPYWSCIPGPPDQDNGMIGQMPVDDTHTIQWYVFHNFEQTIDEYGQAQGFQSMLEQVGASFGRTARTANLWSQSRDSVAAGHWSGLYSALWEDIAITESQGAIADRSHEYLGSSDAAVARLRRILIEAVRDAEHGRAVRGTNGRVNYREIFGRQAVFTAGETWTEAVAALPLPAALQS